MALALNNAQGELSPLEVGLHALHSGLSQRAYADQTKTSRDKVKDRTEAATVMEAAGGYPPNMPWQALTSVHASPQWLWRALVSALVSGGWTVEAARKSAQRVKDVEAPPSWADAEKIAAAVVAGDLAPLGGGSICPYSAIRPRGVPRGQPNR